MHLAALIRFQAGKTRRSRQSPRHNWPETDVGAGLLAKRRVGGARSQGRRKNQDMHLAALTQSQAKPTRRSRQSHRHNWPETDVGAGLLAKRRAGGARSQGRWISPAMHLAALTQSQAGKTGRSRQSHRHNWPETDVGAGLLAKRRAGGAPSQGHRRTQAMHLEALMRFHDRLLGAPLEISSWPPSGSRWCCSVLETVRRPRGASRASSAPTFVSGQLCLCHCLVRLGCSPWDRVRAARCMA